MTMTKDEINELIKGIEETQKHALSTRTKQKWYSVKQALTEYRDSLDRFDVLQHFMSGGLLHLDDWGCDGYIFYDGMNIVDENGEKQNTCVLFKNLKELKPYEPPVEDMLEDGCFYWINLLGQKSVCVWDANHYENGAFIVGAGHWHSIEKERCEPILRDGKPIKVDVPE